MADRRDLDIRQAKNFSLKCDACGKVVKSCALSNYNLLIYRHKKGIFGVDKMVSNYPFSSKIGLNFPIADLVKYMWRSLPAVRDPNVNYCIRPRAARLGEHISDQ